MNSDRFSFADFCYLLWRYKIFVVAAALIVPTLVCVVASQLTLHYRATGVLVIADEQPAIPELQSPLWRKEGIKPETVQTEIQVLQSRDLLEQVVGKLGLTQRAEFRPSEVSMCRGLGMESWLPSLCVGPSKAERAEPTGYAIDALESNLRFSNNERSFAIGVNYTGSDPLLSRDIVNAVMDTYVAHDAQQRNRATVEANQWLKGRLSELRAAMDDTEAQIREQRRKYGLLDRGPGSLGEQDLVSLSAQLNAARSDMARAAAKYQQSLDISKKPSTAKSLSGFLDSPLLQRLAEREAITSQRLANLDSQFGPKHPDRERAAAELLDVQRSISVEAQKMAGALGNELSAARERVQSLEAALTNSKRAGTDTAQAYAVLMQLENADSMYRKLYSDLYARVEQTSQPITLARAGAYIAQHAATPRLPASPSLKVLVLLGIASGLAIGAALAVALHRRDDRLDDVNTLETATGLTTIGAVPALPSLAWWRRNLRAPTQDALVKYVRTNPHSSVAETIRAVRVNVAHVLGEGGRVVLITSAHPAEGKTNFAVSLAHVAAEDGQRVLVIDGDLRRSSTSTYLNNVEIRAGFAQSDQWVIATDRLRPEMSYLKFRGDCASPQRVLQGATLRQIVGYARKEFDLIVIDTPPVMAVSDAMILARLADLTVLLLKWRKARGRTVAEVLRRLEYAGAGAVVGVLAGVRSAQRQYAYYGY